MRGCARSSFPPFRHVARLALVAAAIGLACGGDGPLSDEEMSLLRRLALAGQPPADLSNAYVDSLDAARLGKRLYFDPGYSGPLGVYNVAQINGALGDENDEGKIACNNCHDLGQSGVDRRSHPNATSLGASYTARNAPTVINAAYSLWQFWDGRADSLWSQALAPPEGPSECNGSRLAVAHVLFDHYRDDYDRIFAEPLPAALATDQVFELRGKPGDAAFDDLSPEDQATINVIYGNFGKAIAAFEQRLVSTAFEPSPFDRFMAGDEDAMSPAAVRGARLFVGRAGCAECHGGPMLSDFAFHNIGVPQTGEHVPPSDNGRSTGIDEITASLVPGSQYDFTRQGALSDHHDDTHLAPLMAGGGLAGTTMARTTDGQFKTPSLRNVAKTAPYMHDGAYATLWDVVNHYNFGGATGPYAGTKDPALAPLLLTDAELGDLVEFLRALDDGPPLPTDDFPEGLLAKP
jgi:cytochrome c peroxidase